MHCIVAVGTAQAQHHLATVQVIKNLLIEGHDTRFAYKYSFIFIWDEYLQAVKWMPRLLIS